MKVRMYFLNSFGSKPEAESAAEGAIQEAPGGSEEEGSAGQAEV